MTARGSGSPGCSDTLALMADAPQWVSIIEGVGGALGAVSAAGVAALALVLQRRSNREERERQERQQREDRDATRAAARSERIWEQRSNVYLDLLEALQPDVADSPAEKMQRMYDEAWPLRSRVHAFAARDVVKRYGEFILMTRLQLSPPERPIDNTDVDETRKALRMAIRASNGVDYADHVDSPLGVGGPEPLPQPPWQPPDLPGYGPAPGWPDPEPPRPR